MFVQAFTVLLPPALQATASPDQRQSIFKTSDECAKGVHIIGVRGVPGEKPGFGALQDVVDKLMDKLPGSDSVAIDYPASGLTIGDHGEPSVDLSLYRVSELFGLRKLTSEFEDHNERCPDTGIIVMGFSQGAHVVGDALCGVAPGLFESMSPIDYEYTSSIRAIIQLGDPTNAGGLPWHTGNSTGAGLFPREDLDACRRYGDFWQSYCDRDDSVCDRGASAQVHLGYVERYRDEIVDFIVEKVKGSQSRGFENRGKSDDL